ncbi:MAG: hypothetical protein OEN01_10315 [Candidatus Krumholzibacteria bacterium]|nr:hypothetical protein [Candidatus Krumholzibacteria bacterium]
MRTSSAILVITVSLMMAFFGAWSCSRENPTSSELSPVAGTTHSLGVPEIIRGEPEPPSGQVEISGAGATLNVWPYTGTNFAGAPQDPINLVFVGQADPAKIRAALLSLDGDRTSFGFPPVPPFNGTWSDALGNVQTSYSEGDGWVGNVIQLQLGSYETVRFHLRLFATGKPFGSNGGWTVANAHFDVQIPGTADHQVICWELAEAIVAADLVRSGLLGAPPSATGIINQEPYFRDIPAVLYNGLPEELKAVCDLPPGPATDAVPLPNNGVATLLYVVGETSVEPEVKTETFTVQFGQVIPRPFCNRGPLDFVFVQGPLNLSKTVRIGETGRYQYESSISGHLIATPVDVTQSPPAPNGEPFRAIISDEQRGFIDAHGARVTFDSKRIAPQDGGAEKLLVDLKVSTRGEKSYRSITQCVASVPPQSE